MGDDFTRLRMDGESPKILIVLHWQREWDNLPVHSFLLLAVDFRIAKVVNHFFHEIDEKESETEWNFAEWSSFQIDSRILYPLNNLKSNFNINGLSHELINFMGSRTSPSVNNVQRVAQRGCAIYMNPSSAQKISSVIYTRLSQESLIQLYQCTKHLEIVDRNCNWSTIMCLILLLPIISTICGDVTFSRFLLTSSGQNDTLNFVNATRKCKKIAEPRKTPHYLWKNMNKAGWKKNPTAELK